jgi:hypothetical protein
MEGFQAILPSCSLQGKFSAHVSALGYCLDAPSGLIIEGNAWFFTQRFSQSA